MTSVIQGRIDMVLNAGGRGGFVIVGRGLSRKFLLWIEQPEPP